MTPLKAGLKIDKVSGEIEIKLLFPRQGLEKLKRQLSRKRDFMKSRIQESE